MTYRDPQVTVEWATRLCEVNGELGYFHTWETWSNVVDASPLRGGHPGGQISQLYGIVEFVSGVKRVDPAQIKFCDELHAGLAVMNSRRYDSAEGEDSV